MGKGRLSTCSSMPAAFCSRVRFINAISDDVSMTQDAVSQARTMSQMSIQRLASRSLWCEPKTLFSQVLSLSVEQIILAGSFGTGLQWEESQDFGGRLLSQLKTSCSWPLDRANSSRMASPYPLSFVFQHPGWPAQKTYTATWRFTLSMLLLQRFYKPWKDDAVWSW